MLPTAPLLPRQPPPSKVLASEGCLVCRKHGGFEAELPQHLPSLVRCLCQLVRASLSLVTLIMVLNWFMFPTNTSRLPWWWDLWDHWGAGLVQRQWDIFKEEEEEILERGKLSFYIWR